MTMRELEYYWRECLILVLMLSVLLVSVAVTDLTGGAGESTFRSAPALDLRIAR